MKHKKNVAEALVLLPIFTQSSWAEFSVLFHEIDNKWCFNLNNLSGRTKRLIVLNSAYAGPEGVSPKDGPSHSQPTHMQLEI
jgi:hypothetical protein